MLMSGHTAESYGHEERIVHTTIVMESDKPVETQAFVPAAMVTPILRRVATGKRIMKVLRITRYIKRARTKFGLKHVLPVLLLLIYTFVGACVFYGLEHADDQALVRQTHESYEKAKRQLAERIWELRTEQSYTYKKVITESEKAIVWFEMQINCTTYRDSKRVLRWNFWGAIFYVATIYTTIGYGNIAPRTYRGQLFTMIYALFGIPLMFAILNLVGNGVARYLYRLWKLILRTCRRMRQAVKSRINRRKRLAMKKSSAVSQSFSTSEEIDPDFSEQADKRTKLHEIPLLFPIALTFSWMVMCSALFCIWESEWDYVSAFYFFFVSLTTIGLGDIVPNRYDLMTIAFPLIIIGLALVSMCITIVQSKIDHIFNEKVRLLTEHYKELLAKEGTASLSADDMHKLFKDLPAWVRPLISKQRRQLDSVLEHSFPRLHAETQTDPYDIESDEDEDEDEKILVDIRSKEPLFAPQPRPVVPVAAAPPFASAGVPSTSTAPWQASAPDWPRVQIRTPQMREAKLAEQEEIGEDEEEPAEPSYAEIEKPTPQEMEVQAAALLKDPEFLDSLARLTHSFMRQEVLAKRLSRPTQREPPLLTRHSSARGSEGFLPLRHLPFAEESELATTSAESIAVAVTTPQAMSPTTSATSITSPFYHPRSPGVSPVRPTSPGTRPKEPTLFTTEMSDMGSLPQLPVFGPPRYPARGPAQPSSVSNVDLRSPTRAPVDPQLRAALQDSGLGLLADSGEFGEAVFGEPPAGLARSPEESLRMQRFMQDVTKAILAKLADEKSKAVLVTVATPQEAPAKEVFRTMRPLASTDEERTLFRELGARLTECQDILLDRV